MENSLKLQTGAVQIMFVYQRVAITEQIGEIGDGLGFTPSVNGLARKKMPGNGGFTISYIYIYIYIPSGNLT